MDAVHWVKTGTKHRSAGRVGEAASAFEQALAIDRHCVDAYCHLAELSENLGQFPAAVQLYQQAIALDSQNPRLFARLGNLLLDHGNPGPAEQCYVAGLSVVHDGRDVELRIALLNQMGVAQIQQQKFAAAEAAFRQIVELSPNFAEVHSNLANVLERLGKLDDALAAAERAVQLKPNYAEGHNNLGVALRALHRIDAARDAFARAVALKPDFPLARFNHGTACLMSGDYREGWKGYEWRNLTLATPPRKFDCPHWDGQAIPHRTLLVHTEQGYGDSIQFARFLPLAQKQSGARIILEGPRDLLPLLKSIPGVAEFIVAGTSLPHCDYEIGLPSLPGALHVELSNLPAQVPYLNVDESRREFWRELLSKLSQENRANPSSTAHDSDSCSSRKLRIGIVWQGNPTKSQDHVRSCGLSHFARFRELKSIDWFSLQKGPKGESQLAANSTGLDIIPLSAHLHDFVETAAAICELDLVITVDTSVAHLAGALGRPVWTLLCHTPDWRWQLGRVDSPWYPTMRLFRQPSWGDWPAVFEAVAAQLSSLKETGSF